MALFTDSDGDVAKMICSHKQDNPNKSYLDVSRKDDGTGDYEISENMEDGAATDPDTAGTYLFTCIAFDEYDKPSEEVTFSLLV